MEESPSEEKRIETLKETYRVLKNGGEMILSTWAKGHARIENRGKEFFVPWTVGEKKVQRYTYIYGKDELIEQLKSVGFEIISVEEGKNIIIKVKKN